jgi:hypothetical protein
MESASKPDTPPAYERHTMFTFTSEGQAVVISREDLPTFNPADITFASLWVEAAITADQEDFCPQYDRIARAIGGPDRETLRSLGLLPQKSYDVRVSRTVRIYQDVVQYGNLTVEADDADDAHEQALQSEYINWDEDISPDRWSWEIDSDADDADIDVEYVTATE